MADLITPVAGQVYQVGVWFYLVKEVDLADRRFGQGGMVCDTPTQADNPDFGTPLQNGLDEWRAFRPVLVAAQLAGCFRPVDAVPARAAKLPPAPFD